MKNKNNIISKIKKSMEKNPGFKKITAIAILILLVAVFGFWLKSRADAPTTSLTVTGQVPDAPHIAYEYVAIPNLSANTDFVSNATFPTNAGTTIKFKATAFDSNGDQWHLIVCRNNRTPALIENDPDFYPTCLDNSGDPSSTNTLCTSRLFANSDAENTCDYQTQISDPEVNDWYAYACDSTGCSTNPSTGSKSDGSESPFNVNHRPTFTSANVDPENPGGPFPFTTVASDPDTNANDTVSLFVCKAADFSVGSDNNPSCGAGGTWCSDTAKASDPGCADMAGMPIQDKSYNAYPYIVDSFGFVAFGGAQASNTPAVVNNVAPVVVADSITLLNSKPYTGVAPFDDPAGPLGLNEDIMLRTPMGADGSGGLTGLGGTGDTTDPAYPLKFTVTDANGCLNSSSGQEINSTDFIVYRSSVTHAQNCKDDNGGTGGSNFNNCYYHAGDCTQDVGTCSGAGDTSADWTCGVVLGAIADPTDTGSKYTGDTWKAAIVAQDDGNNGGGSNLNSNGGAFTVMGSGITPPVLGQFLFYSVPETSIAYGNISPVGISDGKTTTLTARGNTGIHSSVYGSDMTRSGGTETIGVANQHYMLTDALFNYNDAMVTSLTAAPAVAVVDYCAKPTGFDLGASPPSTISFTTVTQSTYWKIKVPSGSPAGTYTGTNTIIGAVSTSTHW